MKILAIESSSLVASAAVTEDDVTVAEYTVNFKKTHSQTLLPMIDQIAAMTELDMDSVDAIAVSGGPGSFTGLRIGSATAKGLGLALKKPLIHVPTLDAMAWNLYGASGLICPVMDARRNQVYTGIYRFEKEFQIVMESSAMDIHDLIQKLNGMGERVIFLGDRMPVCRSFWKKNDSALGLCAGPVQPPAGSSVAALGARYLEEGKVESAAEHRPDYLKKAQAERELEEAKRQGKVKELAAGHSVGTGEPDTASESRKTGNGADTGKEGLPEEEKR